MTIPWNDLPYVGTVQELERFGTPVQRNRDKVLAVLQEVHRKWIAACPLIFVGTSAGDGTCDVSPKGDPPGFVRVLDDSTLAIPERVGNRRMGGFRNVLSNPRVGLIFLIPGRPERLRVNGSARLVTDGPFFDDLIVRHHRPHLALLVHVEEVFFHCPKAFARSHTWKPERWNPRPVGSTHRLPRRCGAPTRASRRSNGTISRTTGRPTCIPRRTRIHRAARRRTARPTDSSPAGRRSKICAVTGPRRPTTPLAPNLARSLLGDHHGPDRSTHVNEQPAGPTTICAEIRIRPGFGVQLNPDGDTGRVGDIVTGVGPEHSGDVS